MKIAKILISLILILHSTYRLVWKIEHVPVIYNEAKPYMDQDALMSVALAALTLDVITLLSGFLLGIIVLSDRNLNRWLIYILCLFVALSDVIGFVLAISVLLIYHRLKPTVAKHT